MPLMADGVGEELPRSLTDLAVAFRERRLSPVEVVGTLLERIEGADGELNSFITVLPERALEEAKRAERAAADSRSGMAGTG